jgi:phosphoglycolate phosphatase
MRKTYELIVFDWDGTLIDSEARIVTCMQCAARDTGVPEPTQEAARDIIGLGMKEAVERLFPALERREVENLIDAYRVHWLGNQIAEAQMFSGARELLEALRNAGHLLAVPASRVNKPDVTEGLPLTDVPGEILQVVVEQHRADFYSIVA